MQRPAVIGLHLLLCRLWRCTYQSQHNIVRRLALQCNVQWQLIVVRCSHTSPLWRRTQQLPYHGSARTYSLMVQRRMQRQPTQLIRRHGRLRRSSQQDLQDLSALVTTLVLRGDVERYAVVEVGGADCGRVGVQQQAHNLGAALAGLVGRSLVQRQLAALALQRSDGWEGSDQRFDLLDCSRATLAL